MHFSTLSSQGTSPKLQYKKSIGTTNANTVGGSTAVLPQIRFSGPTEDKLYKSLKQHQFDEARDLVLTKGADVNASDDNKETPLTRAVRKGNHSEIQLLCELNADLDAQDEAGWTPLTLASANGKLDTVKLLHSLKANMTIPNKEGRTAMTVAALKGRLDIIKYLHSLKVNINAQDAEGWTPLTLAAARNQLDAIQLLHDLGADMKRPQAKGLSPRDCAKAKGNVEAQKLIERLIANSKKNDSPHSGSSGSGNLKSSDFPSVSNLPTPQGSVIGSRVSLATLKPYRDFLKKVSSTGTEQSQGPKKESYIAEDIPEGEFKNKEEFKAARLKKRLGMLQLTTISALGIAGIAFPPLLAGAAGAASALNPQMWDALRYVFSLSSDLADNPTTLPKFKENVKKSANRFSIFTKRVIAPIRNDKRFQPHTIFLEKLADSFQAFSVKIQSQNLEQCLKETVEFEQETLDRLADHLQLYGAENDKKKLYQIQEFARKYNKYLEKIPENLADMDNRNRIDLQDLVDRAKNSKVPELVEWSKHPQNLAFNLARLKVVTQYTST